jgi:hypothetical protein
MKVVGKTWVMMGMGAAVETAARMVRASRRGGGRGGMWRDV